MYVLPVAITFVCVASVAVGLRLFTRIYLVCAPGWDDWILLLAMITDYVFFAWIVVENHYGLGEHAHDLHPDELRSQLKALWITIPLYNLSLNLTKVSILLLYLRIFTTKTYRILLIAVLVFVICTGLWMVFSALLFCLPVQSFWDPTIEHTCLSKPVVWSLNAALQIVTDLTIVLLPMPLLATLRIPPRQKICLMFVFALDDNGPAATWSFVESNVALVCASLPVLRPLLVRVFPHLMLSRIRNSYCQREKRSQEPVMGWSPFQGANTNYSASVTGNCSASVDGLESSSHRHPDTEGIQVVSELRWDMNSALNSNGKDSEDPIEQVNSNTPPSIRFM
ncbi:hypothetical protein AOCH_000035 [Aspergillus ochraceoroseus]|uniref:Rhodopsin domain-containing protein n=1 Tax=Aspergillus ochraceoroseus TaxID=138278 RepID=A0A0F8TX60_9EURO|nr:hypothetical protein AOCH_000035 [Aspergillus ochraceoroseus]